MRIQHNIPAMSAYRHYTNNTSALAKNLEKLSSGYRINRAGDDAAGLAISEKMRAQITGLEVAQKNAKDGISLVQTAEGALTEVHDMLNRMYALAEQSANGTYDTFDREQLQKEVDSLRTEIDRIAKSSNFNGISLLDGSMRQGTAGETQVALNKAYLEKLSFDGQTASKAGVAEITFDFASVGSNKVVTAKIDKDTAKTFDGVEPTAATQTQISFALGAASDVATVFGQTITPGTTDLASLGSVTVADGKTVADLFDLYDGSTLMGGTNHTDWTQTLTSAANKTYTLKAKTPGSLGDNVKTALDTVASTDTATTVVAHGVDEGRGAPETQAVYEITLDLTKIAGGQTIEIAGEKFLISNDPSATAGSTDTDTGATVISIAGMAADTGVTPATGDNSLYDIANAIQTQINSKLGSLFTVDTLDAGDITQASGAYKLKLTGTQGAKSTFDAVHVTNSSGQDITATTLTFTPTTEYAPAGADNLGKNAQVTYKNAVDINKLTAGSKIQIGGSVDTNGTVSGTGITIEIAETKADENFATGKIYLGDLTSTADKIAYINSAIARVNGGSATFAAKLETPASGTVCNLVVTGGMSDKALSDASASITGLDASTAVSTFYKNNAAVQGTINGTTVEVGKTTYQEILDIGLGSGFGTIGENFDIYKVTASGETKLTGAALNGAVDGSSIVLKAKTAGKLDKTNVMDKVTAIGGSGISVSSKDGWDEGQNESGKTTSYQLKFDLDKLAGGQSFSIGNSTGSITFDISVDPDSVNNGVQADGANGTEVANRKTLDLSKVDLTNLSDEDNKTAIINAFKGVVGANGMSATDWKASASIDASGVLTLDIVANEADEKFNLGTIRYSQSENAGAISGAKYNVYNSSKGGQQGTYAKVVYDLDVSKFQKGDVLTFAGKTVEIGDKSGTFDDGTGTEKNYISLADAKSATKLAEKLESMLGADQTFAGRVQVDNSAKQLIITDYQTGRTAEDFANEIAANLTSNTRDLNAMTGGLLLQIGDTADTYNQLRVSINDCHAAAMIDGDSGKSIADIDISTQDGAADAMKVIKAAINYVSDVRGTLGATQNRLDHTINNLSVMRENIQDAESTIRDVDVAEEMMAYTKNNILVQSAQAMLAQANQLPQGVLQLLQ